MHTLSIQIQKLTDPQGSDPQRHQHCEHITDDGLHTCGQLATHNISTDADDGAANEQSEPLEGSFCQDHAIEHVTDLAVELTR